MAIMQKKIARPPARKMKKEFKKGKEKVKDALRNTRGGKLNKAEIGIAEVTIHTSRGLSQRIKAATVESAQVLKSAGSSVVRKVEKTSRKATGL